MDVEVRAGSVVGLNLSTPEDFDFALRALRAHYLQALREEMQPPLPDWAVPLRALEPQDDKAHYYYCGQADRGITNARESGRLHLEEPVAPAAYLGMLAGILELAQGDAERGRAMHDMHFAFVEK